MTSFLNALAHYLLLLIKPPLVLLVQCVHELTQQQRYPDRPVTGLAPDGTRIKGEYEQVLRELPKFLTPGVKGGSLYRVNPDHQALRQGSLAWATRDFQVIEGMRNFIHEGVFIRGWEGDRPDHFDAVPAMPMSVAFAIMVGVSSGYVISKAFQAEFLAAVDALDQQDFKMGDASTAPRALSTGFDAVFACSLLLTAHALSGDYKYLKRVYQILFWRGFALLLLAPLTWWRVRLSFIEHIAMFGAWTCVQASPNGWVRFFFKQAMYWVLHMNHRECNPYFAALAQECRILEGDYGRKVLAVHALASPIKACSVATMASYDGRFPVDWSTYRTDEFPFDSEPVGSALGLLSPQAFNPLNGLALARSLLVLMR